MPRAIFICIITQVLLSACAVTRSPSEAPEFTSHGQAPIINLNAYQSVQKRRGPQNENIVVASAISGGGHRAANFGAGVLSGLERIAIDNGGSNVLTEIDYFSTVSGGGFAAGSYISTLYDYLQIDNGKSVDQKYADFSYYMYLDTGNDTTGKDRMFCRSCDVAQEKPVCVKRNIERGYRSPIVRSFMNPSIWFTSLDRGDYLEEKIDSKLLASCWRESNRSMVLGDIFKKTSEPAPRLPYWVTNATVYENGAIFPITPDILDTYKITGLMHNLEYRCVNELDEQCLNDYFDVPLAVGVKASATFPGLVPATTLTSKFDESNGYIHLFDGGISDNLGVLTAMSLLSQDDGIGEKLPVKILIVIDAYRDELEPFSSTGGSPRAYQISNKLYEMPLSSWRGRHMRVLDQMKGSINGEVEVIYLNFETIAYSSKELHVEGCEEYSKEDIVYMAKNVSTDFDLDQEEQEQLYCAGLMAAKEMEDTIVSIFDSAYAR